MKHSSVATLEPIEIIDIQPFKYSPLISKCQIKVCYVSDDANRNKSVITKEVATKIAPTLRGCPIVGYFDRPSADYEEHNRQIILAGGKFEVEDTTKPYGFVDLNAKVWFQKFIDDDQFEREYMVTEGYLWTDQYPECQRVIDKGNNHSMELDEKTLDATWTKDNNGNHKFFIINEAIISKLCILGEEYEPCFEGATITKPKINFSLDDNFKEQLFSMMKELKELLKEEGGERVFNTYAVEVGDAVWTSLYSHVQNLNSEEIKYGIEAVCEEEDQKFAVLKSDTRYYRLDFSLSEAEEMEFAEDLVEVTETYTPLTEPQFSAEAIETFEAEFAAKGKEEDKDDDDDEDKCPKCGKPKDECECDDDDDDKKKKYNLEDVVEYAQLNAEFEELKTRFSDLEESYNTLKDSKEQLEADLVELREFKKASEVKEKKALIESFYMLSEEDKQEVSENIDKYSLDDIEAKLSIICVRNKVSFDLNENKTGNKEVTTFNLNETNANVNMPDWVKAVIATSESKI